MVTSTVKMTEDEPLSSGATSHLNRLVSHARSGDRKAFESIARFYWAPVFRMVYHRVRSKMDAEDITQDVFISAFKRIGTLKEDSSFRPWLFTIAINRVRDHKRKSKLMGLIGLSSSKQMVGPEKYEAPGSHDPLNETVKKDFWRKVEDFLAKLSNVEREVFILRFMDQLTISEIAQVMGRTQSTIKTHLYRALNKFRGDKQFHRFIEGLQ